MAIIWINTTALRVTFTPADTNADVEFYKASYEGETCEVNAKASPLSCSLG